MTLGLINANPVVHAKKERIARTEDPHADDAVDPLEIYDILLLLLLLVSLFLFVFVSFKFRFTIPITLVVGKFDDRVSEN